MAHAVFRAEHIGSMLRPPALLEARAVLEGNQYETVAGSRAFAELKQLEDTAIREAVALQEQVGLTVVTDGELRRRSWYQDFVLGLNGTRIAFIDPAHTGGTVSLPFQDAAGADELPGHQVQVEGRLSRSGDPFTEAYAYLRGLTRHTAKVSLPSPTMLHFFGGRSMIDARVYPDLDLFWDDLVTIYREQVGALYAAGCRYLQIDDVTWAVACDPRAEAAIRARGETPQGLFTRYADVLNRILAGVPQDMKVGLHTCRGNNRGKWMADGGYELISEIIFKSINIDTYFMEYDTERAGDFSPLRHVPPGKTVVLGLVSTKTPQLEAPAQLRARIEEAARHLPLDHLCLSPQCGFASNFMGNPLTIDDERAKLKLVVDVARDVWGA